MDIDKKVEPGISRLFHFIRRLFSYACWWII